MPRLRTDDGPRKLRAVWLGPAGHTLPFQWTYVQWAVTLIAVPVAGTIGTAVVWLLLGDPVWAFGIGGLWCGAAGVYLAIRLMRNVTFDEPLGYQRRLVRGEYAREFAAPVGASRIAVQFAEPQIGYLSTAVRKSMNWDVADQQPLATRPAMPPEPRAATVATNPYVSISRTSPTSTEAEARRGPRNPYLTRPSLG